MLIYFLIRSSMLALSSAVLNAALVQNLKKLV